jgi:2-methylisocitrate lyase-like PEP mutase family enzyme
MLREAISGGPMVLAPGAYDALTARLVAELFNLASGGRSPEVSLRELDGWGYRIAILPSLPIGRCGSRL